MRHLKELPFTWANYITFLFIQYGGKNAKKQESISGETNRSSQSSSKEQHADTGILQRLFAPLFHSWENFKEIFSRERPRRETVAERLREELTRARESLRIIKQRYSLPRPEITLFKLGHEDFLPYSTSEREERHKRSYYAALASFYSTGKSIREILLQVTDPNQLSLEECEMYSLLPLSNEVIYVGGAGGTWLFYVKSEKFPRARLTESREPIGLNTTLGEWTSLSIDRLTSC